MRLHNPESGNRNCGSLTIQVARTFFTLLEDSVRSWKIKPQRTQRNTESCYFSLSPPLWFSKTLNRKYQKVSRVSVTATRDVRDPKLSANAHGVAINGSATPEPTDADVRSLGFGHAAMIVLLVYLTIRNR